MSEQRLKTFNEEGIRMSEQEAGWCLIPPHILEREDLTCSQMILFGRIHGLTKSTGYCYASNRWLGEKMKLSPERISHMITDFKRKELLDIELIKDDKDTVIERRIYTFFRGGIAKNSYRGIAKNSYRGIAKNSYRGIAKNSVYSIKDNNKEENTLSLTRKNSKNISPDDSFLELFPQDFQSSREFRRTWLEWLRYRKTDKKSAIKLTTAKKQAALLSKFTLDIAIKMIDRSMTQGYTGIFEVKDFQPKPFKTKVPPVSVMEPPPDFDGEINQPMSGVPYSETYVDLEEQKEMENIRKYGTPFPPTASL